jgi:hypothetical protein
VNDGAAVEDSWVTYVSAEDGSVTDGAALVDKKISAEESSSATAATPVER